MAMVHELKRFKSSKARITMKIIPLKSKKGTNITELFGLSRSGKTTLIKRLIKERKFDFGISPRKNRIIRIIKFLQFFFKHPIRTIGLFSNIYTNHIKLDIPLRDKIMIFLMRNSYLISVLSKEGDVRNQSKKVLVDEYMVQSILMILQKKSTRKQIEKVIRLLNPSCNILIVEESSKKRYERFRQHRFPGGHINEKYSLKWMKNQEYNYKIIKEILLEQYDKEEKDTNLR
jgi:hypothetical protein